MTIQLDPNISKSLSDGMKSSGGVELPFPVPYLWALNGLASYKAAAQSTPALYYGGFAVKAEQMDDVLGQTGSTLPAGFAQATYASKSGDEFEIYSTRSLIIAPIAKRESWITGDNHRRGHYVEGGRYHIQVLAYLATKADGGDFRPWNPVVVSAKGWQGIKLAKAFKDWEKLTATLRSKIAPGVPAWCFYLAVGTFGKDRTVENVGKSGAQSPITPITLYAPPDLKEAHLEKLFVGDAVAQIMATRKDEAAEWLAEWGKAETAPTGEENGAIPDEGPANFEDIPF